MLSIFASDVTPYNTTIKCYRLVLAGIFSLTLCLSIQIPVNAEQNDVSVAAQWIDPDQINNALQKTIQDGGNFTPEKQYEELSWDFVDQVSTTLSLNKENVVLIFDSVERLLNNGHSDIAVKLINQFDKAGLSASQSSLFRLLEAKAFYMIGESQQSLNSLNRIDGSDLSDHHLLIAAWLRTANLVSLKRITSALQSSKIAMVNRDSVLSHKTAELICNNLLLISAREMEEYVDSTTDPYSIAWFALASSLKQAIIHNSPQELKAWMQNNSSHGAYNYAPFFNGRK